MGFGGNTAIESIKKLVFHAGYRSFSERLFNNLKRPRIMNRNLHNNPASWHLATLLERFAGG
jgi:hypothetical protein